MTESIVTIVAKVTSYNPPHADIISTTEPLDVDFIRGVFITKENYAIGDRIVITARHEGNNLQILTHELFSEPAAHYDPDQWSSVGDMYFSPMMRVGLDGLGAIAKSLGAANGIIEGPSGYGKTSAAEVWARENGYDFIRMNCAHVRETEEWFGQRNIASGKKIIFEESKLTKMIRKGSVVVVLDELNRAETWLHGVWFPLLDHARHTEYLGLDLTVGPNTIFIITINEGAAYTGTFGPLDSAFKNRMDGYIRVENPPVEIEARILQDRYSLSSEDASMIANLMSGMRDLLNDLDSLSVMDISPRTALKLAAWTSTAHQSLRVAAQVVLVNQAPLDIQRDITDYLNRSIGELVL